MAMVMIIMIVVIIVVILIPLMIAQWGYLWVCGDW